MKHTIHASRLQKMMAQRNGYLALAAGLLLLCLLLGCVSFCLVGRERIIITPPVVHRSFWVSHQAVSPEYLSEITEFLAQLRLTVTPSNAAYQREALLRYTHPSYYGVLKNALMAEAEHLIQSHISLAFYPVQISVNAKQLTAQLIGDLQSTIGDTPASTVRVTYQLRYRYINGKLLLTAFQEERKSHG